MFGLWRKWISYPLWWAVIVGGFAIGQTVLAGMGETYPDMESFEGRYHAARTADGSQVTMEVTETIEVLLRNERGILRDLVGTYGETPLLYEDVEVHDGDGEPVEFTTSGPSLRSGDIQLRIGDGSRRSGLHTYVISYTTTPNMIGTTDYQELYFNINGTEWPNGFKQVSAVLTIDGDLAGDLSGDQACYQGRAGSTQTCDIRRTNDTTWVAAVEQLGPWENLTVAVGFEPGTVADPVPPFRSASLGWWGIAITVAIGAVPLVIALLVRAVVGNLTRGETGVVTQFDPPEKIPPVVAADFLGRPERGAAAHLAWLVTQGHGTLTGAAEAAQAPGPGRDDLDRRTRQRLGTRLELTWERAGLDSSMRRVSELLFGREGKPVDLGSYRYESRLVEAQQYRDELVERRELRHTVNVGPLLLWGGFLALVGFGIFQLHRGLAGLGMYWLGATAVAFVLLMAAVHLMPVHYGLTRRGKEARRHLMGLERFIRMSEANRIAWLQNAQDAPRDGDEVKLYEKLLPWAIVFGEERSWGQLLGHMYDRFPERRTPRVPAMTLLGHSEDSAFERDRQFYDDRRRRHRSSYWNSRPDLGEGSATQAWSDMWQAMADHSAGRGDSDTSTRSSGRGWSGGRSTSSGGGSRGGGSSGGGSRGGGGGRW